MSNQHMPQPPEEAPDIELADDEGRWRRLTDARGSWLVLYFYPEDDSPGCTVEACAFRDAHADIRERGADVWGVSVLGSESKRTFKQKHGLTFTLLADEDHSVAEAYGTWVEKEKSGRRYWGIQRATFLIDPEGRVVHVWPKVRPEGHTAEVISVLDEEQRRRQAPGAA